MTQLALVIDLNVCVGCHACVTSCKQWNTSGTAGALVDLNPYGADPNGTFFNRVQTFEVGEFPNTQTVHFPKSCLHCEDPPCVPVCPTGASYKRAEDGIVLVDYDKCIGCRYCMVACPYTGVRQFNFDEPQYSSGFAVGSEDATKHVKSTVEKCTFCAHRLAKGQLPACIEQCPARARHFGDLNDPNSEVAQLLRERSSFRLLEEKGTEPSVYFLT